ncbi:MAG: hypothetical protein JWN48_2255 [Myxococcaceae bacterium]|nr:hypothetical protein [Myxococcaceae bacterium]
MRASVRLRVAALLGGALVVALVPCAPRAHAQAAHATRGYLEWTRSDSEVCAAGALLEREVEELAGHRIFVPRAEADLIVHGGIEVRGQAARAWFEARASDGSVVGRRVLHGDRRDCASLLHTMALVLTIMLDRPSSAMAEPTPAPPPSHLRTLHGGAWVGLLSGALPRPAPGFGLTLELAVSRFARLRADAAYWLPSARTDGLGVGAELSAVSGQLALCPRWPQHDGRLALIACAGSTLGAIVAHPRGLDGPERVARLWAQATLELGLSLEVGRLTTLFASVGAALALTRPRFYYQREDGSTLSVHRPSSAGVIARIGLTIGRP